MAQVEQQPWPHAKALREIRGPRSVDKAARMVDVTRQTWAAWEAGRQVPSHDRLRAIVEAFECPPELVGYEAPRGWDLVPGEWIRQQHEQQMAAVEDIPNLRAQIETIAQDIRAIREHLESQATDTAKETA